jgi:Family of unknown function (DUF5309)
MTVVAGQRTVENIASEQRVIDQHPKLLLLEPDAAPLTVISKRIAAEGGTTPAKDPTFHWDEDELETRFDAVNHSEGYEDSDTSIVVDTGGVFYANSIVQVPRTGEQIYIESVSSNTLTVERGFAGTTAAALEDDDPLFVIGGVVEEGVGSPEARSGNPTQRTNYTEITRTSVEASGTLLSTSNATQPHDWPYQHKKGFIEHLKTLEFKSIFGVPSNGTGPNGKPLRTTGGLLHFCTANNQDAGGELTETEWEEWVRALSRYSGGTKVVFCSSLVISVLNNFSIGRMQTHVGEETYGVKVMELISAHGTMKLVEHKLLEGEVWGGYAIAVDFKIGDFQYKPLGGEGAPNGTRDTKLLTNRQSPEADAQKDEWLTEAGWLIAQPKAHGILTGVTK